MKNILIISGGGGGGYVGVELINYLYEKEI